MINAEEEAAITADFLAAKAGIVKLAHGVDVGPCSGSRRRGRYEGRKAQIVSAAFGDSLTAFKAFQLPPPQLDAGRGQS